MANQCSSEESTCALGGLIKNPCFQQIIARTVWYDQHLGCINGFWLSYWRSFCHGQAFLTYTSYPKRFEPKYANDNTRLLARDKSRSSSSLYRIRGTVLVRLNMLIKISTNQSQNPGAKGGTAGSKSLLQVSASGIRVDGSQRLGSC